MRGNSSNETKMAAKLSKEEAEEYFTRINYTGSKEPTVEVLTELHRCHILSVPFENLSVYGKEKIELSKEWLFEKIVRRHRGGFCFELNTMFSFLLDYLGFEYTTHAASVLDRKTGVLGPPVEHRVLMVKSEASFCSPMSGSVIPFGCLFVSLAYKNIKNNRVALIEFERAETTISMKKR